MTGPILIGLCGRRGGGKDTAASFIHEWGESRGLAVVRRSFADKLKYSAMTALGFTVSEEDAVVLADSLKEIGEITTIIPNQSVAYTIDGRKFLQLYGTEAHRDVFGSEFWVDALLPIHPDNAPWTPSMGWPSNFTWENDKGWKEPADIAVVADVRFENEAQRIKDLGGVVWQINRPGGENDEHRSEAGIPDCLVNTVIENDADLQSLRIAVLGEMSLNFHSHFAQVGDTT